MGYILVIKNINYQYIMEELIDKLEDINILLEALDDDENNKYEQELLEEINKINLIIDGIKNKLLTLKLSEEKCLQIESRNKKEKILSKKLFPYYWMLNEYINNQNK